MLRLFTLAICGIGSLLLASTPLHAAVMTFDNGTFENPIPAPGYTIYVEDGIYMIPEVYPGGFDAIQIDNYDTSDTDLEASSLAITSEPYVFDMNGDFFNLVSLDIVNGNGEEGFGFWQLEGGIRVGTTFTSMYVLPIVPIDYGTLAISNSGFQGINYFKLDADERGGQIYIDNVTTSQVPEPSSLLTLAGLASCFGLGLIRRRRSVTS